MHIVTDNNAKKQDSLHIPREELHFDTSRSRGPGGQNVNKCETKVRLSFNVTDSRALTQAQKETILNHPHIKDRLYEGTTIRIMSQVHKTQGANKQDAIDKLHLVLEKALEPVKERIPGGKPPHLKFPPSEFRRREIRRAQDALKRSLREQD